MSRRQAQWALADAAALFNSEILATTGRPTVGAAGFEVRALRQRDTRRGGSDSTTGIGQEWFLRSATERDLALSRTVGLVPFVSLGPGIADAGLAGKIRSKVHDLFAIGEQVAKASGAKQLQIQVGLPWTATVALTWDLP